VKPNPLSPCPAPLYRTADMKRFVCFVLALCLVGVLSDEVKAKNMVAVKIATNLEQLPEGFVNPISMQDLQASNLGTNMRFADAQAQAQVGDVFTGSSDADPSEFDGKIEQTTNQLKQLDNELKEAEECARRVTELRAQKRDLQENLDNWQKEKEKAILEQKLAQQMQDLNQVASMSRDLRGKYNELKRTQDLIRSRLTGTRTSLSQLEGDTDSDPNVIVDDGQQIAAEMDAMHKAQAQILSASHFKNVEAVKQQLEAAKRAHDGAIKAGRLDEEA